MHKFSNFSCRFILLVKLKADGERGKLEEDDDIKSKSKTTQAIKLFSEGNSPVEVAIALDLQTDQVQVIYREFWKLSGMFGLAQMYEEAKYDVYDLLRLHRIAKVLGLEKHDIISAFELIKHNQLQALQWKEGYLRVIKNIRVGKEELYEPTFQTKVDDTRI